MRPIDADEIKLPNDLPYKASVKRVLAMAPTIDAVVVIRCKNCGWYELECESCGFWPDEGYRDPEHYCGEGKPRETERR